MKSEDVIDLYAKISKHAGRVLKIYEEFIENNYYWFKRHWLQRSEYSFVKSKDLLEQMDELKSLADKSRRLEVNPFLLGYLLESVILEIFGEDFFYFIGIGWKKGYGKTRYIDWNYIVTSDEHKFNSIVNSFRITTEPQFYDILTEKMFLSYDLYKKLIEDNPQEAYDFLIYVPFNIGDVEFEQSLTELMDYIVIKANVPEWLDIEPPPSPKSPQLLETAIGNISKKVPKLSEYIDMKVKKVRGKRELPPEELTTNDKNRIIFYDLWLRMAVEKEKIILILLPESDYLSMPHAWDSIFVVGLKEERKEVLKHLIFALKITMLFFLI